MGQYIPSTGAEQQEMLNGEKIEFSITGEDKKKTDRKSLQK